MTRRRSPIVAAERDWRVREDLRTLSTAAEIQRDKARLAAAKAEGRKQMAVLSSVAGEPKAKKPASRRKRLENVQL